MNSGLGISYEIALRWMPPGLSDDKSTLVQVMAWCRQATSHHLNQCWPRSLPPYGVTRPQWVKCQGHPVSLWCWPLTCNLQKCYSFRSSFGMYNQERQLWYLHLLTRYCPCNLLPQPTSPKHEYRGKLWDHPLTSSMMSSSWKKTFLGMIWNGLFISEVKLKLCLIFQSF